MTPKQISRCTAKMPLGVVPKDGPGHVLSFGPSVWICRFRKCVDTRAKAGMGFPFQARKASPGQRSTGSSEELAGSTTWWRTFQKICHKCAF